MKTQVNSFVTDDVKPGKMKAIFLGRKGPTPSPNGMMIFWEFTVIQEEDELKVSGVTSQAFSHDSRCKAMKWAKAIDPTFLDDDLEWDDEDALGNTCIVEVVYRESGDQLISSVKGVTPWVEPNPVI